MSILIRIDDRSDRPKFRQIMDQIVELVDSGAVKPGLRLPSTRVMAGRLGVNRTTVYRAYQELWSLGYLESRPGSYSTIRKRTRVAARQSEAGRGLIDWSKRIVPEAEELYNGFLGDEALLRRAAGPEVINFIPLSPDGRLFPLQTFRKCMNEVLVNRGEAVLHYGNPRGYGPLKEYIAERMRRHSVAVSSDEILITTGAQNAVELLLMLLAGPGSSIVIESPTYSRVIDIIRVSDVKIEEAPMGEDGMDLDVLESILDKTSPAMVYTIPNFHNPTGITTDQVHRERLFGLCARHKVPLVEDGFEEEMKYFGKTVLPIKSMDRHGLVIYIGTFSKILFPGLRIGWIAAPKDCIERLAPIQRALIISGNILVQAALERFCRQGHYDLHIKRMHRVYRRRMRTAFRALSTYLDPERVNWTRPSGGYTIWLRLKGFSDENEIADYLIDRGVALLPGRSHFFEPADGIFYRLSIAHTDEAEIEEGIRRLGRALRTAH